MLWDLENAYVEGQPADHQSECIEVFFDRNADWWKEQFHFEQITGEDGETVRMIDLVLMNLGSELSPNVKQMLNDWKEYGF